MSRFRVRVTRFAIGLRPSPNPPFLVVLQVMREPEEVEGLRSTFPTRPAVRHHEPAELDEACLVGVQLKRELAQPLPEVVEKLLRIRLALATNDEVSRPGESHPRALAELYVNVSAHTAPIIQPPVSPPADANGRTAGARDEQGHRASDWLDGDVAVAFCISAWPIEPTGH